MWHPESDMPMLADGEVVDRDVEEQHNPGITFQTDGELEDAYGDGDGEQGGDVATPSHAPDRAGSTADRQDREIADVGESLKAAVAALPKYWGVFTLSVKKPGSVSGGLYGGIQADCPLHARNEKSGCRKYCGFTNGLDSHRQAVLQSLKYWCAQARSSERQWEHVFHGDLVSVPEGSILESMEILDLPLRVVSDSDFYSGVIPTEEAGGVRRRAKRPRIVADAAPKAKAVATRGAGRRAAAAPVLAAAPAAEQA